MNSGLDTAVKTLIDASVPYETAVQDFRRRWIVAMLRKYRGNQCVTARAMGLHRNTLMRQMELLGIDGKAMRNEFLLENPQVAYQREWRSKLTARERQVKEALS